MQRLKDFVGKHGSDIPIVLCGDFNSLPYSPAVFTMHDDQSILTDPEKAAPFLVKPGA
jgi:endonuclease/exonuclease/phosphatase family metal-dependent hydrolase